MFRDGPEAAKAEVNAKVRARLGGRRAVRRPAVGPLQQHVRQPAPATNPRQRRQRRLQGLRSTRAPGGRCGLRPRLAAHPRLSTHQVPLSRLFLPRGVEEEKGLPVPGPAPCRRAPSRRRRRSRSRSRITGRYSDDGGGAVSEPDRRCALTDLHWASTRRRQLRRRGRLRRRRRRLPRPSTTIWSRCAARTEAAVFIRSITDQPFLDTSEFGGLHRAVLYTRAPSAPQPPCSAAARGPASCAS